MAEGFKVNSEESLANAVLWITGLFEKHKYVKLSAQAGKRGLDTNALSHVWYADISRFREDISPIDAKCECKLHIGVPILLTGNEAFAAHYNKFIRGRASYEEKLDFMLYLDVTSIMTHSQMTDYLDQVKKYWSAKGLELKSTKDDR